MTVRELINEQTIPHGILQELICMLKDSTDSLELAMVDAYLYGTIQGKREERARRKKKN